MKINDKYQKMILASILILTAFIFSYQLAYGTNEGSYQWGYKSGKVMSAAIMTLTAITDLAVAILELNYPTV
jgi:hypothetical protein